MPKTKAMPSSTHKVKCGCGNLYIVLSLEPDNVTLAHINIRLGKTGGCARAWSESYGDLILYAIQHGGNIEEIAKLIQGGLCNQPVPNGGAQSCADAIGLALVGQYTALVEAQKK